MRLNKHVLPALAIVFLMISIAVANYLWLSVNQQPPVDDEAVHLISALKYLHILQHPSVDVWSRLVRVDVLYPPLFPFISALLVFILGQASTLSFCMVNVLFLGVLFSSLYFIGLKTANKWSGVLAAYILMLYPMFFHLSRMFMLEVALVSMVALCIALLVYSKNFRSRGLCLLAGVAFGLGLLTKQTFPFFILGPAISLFMKGFSGFKVQEKNKVINVLLFLIVGIGIALPWYVLNWHGQCAGALTSAIDGKLVPYQDQFFSFRSFSYYLVVLADVQIRSLFSIFLMMALILLFVFRKIYRIRLFVVWIAVAYFIMFVYPNKFYYYTLPFLPAVAFLTAWGFLAINIKPLRITAVLLVLFCGILQFISLSYFEPFMRCAVLQGAFYTPRIIYPQADEMIAGILRDMGSRECSIGVGHIDGNEAYQQGIVLGDSGVLLNKHMLKYVLASRGVVCRISDLRSSKWSAGVSDSNFILLPSPWDQVPNLLLPQEQYRLSDVFEMPDLSTVYLYRHIGFAVAPDAVKVHKSMTPLTPGKFNMQLPNLLKRQLPQVNSGHMYWQEKIHPVVLFGYSYAASLARDMWPTLYYNSREAWPTLCSTSREVWLSVVALWRNAVDLWVVVVQKLVHVWVTFWGKVIDGWHVFCDQVTKLWSEFCDQVARQWNVTINRIAAVSVEVAGKSKDVYYYILSRLTLKEISNSEVKLTFQDNTWKIYWKGMEITKSLSLYTSLRLSGSWIDSTQLQWLIHVINNKQMTAIAFRADLSMYQRWDFVLADRRLYWQVQYGKGIVRLEREQVNVMLSEQYGHWFYNSGSGDFPPGFNRDLAGNWQVLQTTYPGREHIGLASDYSAFPKVIFNVVKFAEGLKGYVINSDDQPQARVLQYATKHRDGFVRRLAVYEAFNGYIEFQDKASILSAK